LFTGSLDDVAVWNRGLTDAEAARDYDLSRRGYPGVLNRIDAALWAVPAAVATQYYAWQTAAGGSLWLQAG